jgi:hypothetical protein
LYPDPKIYVLRGFLEEAEMNRLKALAAPKVCGSLVIAALTQHCSVAH